MTLKAIAEHIKGMLSGRQKRFYQEKRDNTENWRMIEEHLADNCRNLLDIACDIGFYTASAARRGILAVGVDINDRAIEKARHLAKQVDQDKLIFSKLALSPTNVGLLPKFDVILCLSVYHHFCRMYGEPAARKMMLDLVDKFDRQMFFQTPSKIGKFRGDLSVDFQNSQQAIEQYVADLFSPATNCVVRFMGKKKEKPPTEEFRYLFLIEKKA